MYNGVISDVFNITLLYKARQAISINNIAAGISGYESVAESLLGQCRVDGFFLEYDSERAGDFRPLRHIKDQQVVLGLITSKSGELENRAAVLERIEEAMQYVPLNQLCLSPQCGFSSTEEGNLLTEEEQWEKLRFVVSLAAEVWK